MYPLHSCHNHKHDCCHREAVKVVEEVAVQEEEKMAEVAAVVVVQMIQKEQV